MCTFKQKSHAKFKALKHWTQRMKTWLYDWKRSFSPLSRILLPRKYGFFHYRVPFCQFFCKKFHLTLSLILPPLGFTVNFHMGRCHPGHTPFFRTQPHTPTQRCLRDYYSLHVSECMLLSDCCCKHLSVAGYPWRDCCCWGVAAVAWIWQYKCLTWLVWGMIIDWKIITAFSQYWYSTQLQQTFS